MTFIRPPSPGTFRLTIAATITADDLVSAIKPTLNRRLKRHTYSICLIDIEFTKPIRITSTITIRKNPYRAALRPAVSETK